MRIIYIREQKKQKISSYDKMLCKQFVEEIGDINTTVNIKKMKKMTLIPRLLK